LISRLLKNQPVDLTKGEQVRDFLYEEDVAAAFVAAAISERLESTEVYNVCASRPTTIREIGELVADAMAKPRDLLHWGERPYRADEPMWMVGDNSRFRQATGSWYPAITLHEGIQRMIVNAQAQSTKRQ
jgi:nucleoside-diphosphate-sugar epimerase